jgi:hypothetical protein
MTRLIEEPITAYGRSWGWSNELRPTVAPTLARGAAADIASAAEIK